MSSVGSGGFVGFRLFEKLLLCNDLLSAYASSLPASALPHLDQQLNWTDLTEIAHHMLDWEEKLCTHLGLTAVDIHDIKAKHQNNPKLQR